MSFGKQIKLKKRLPEKLHQVRYRDTGKHYIFIYGSDFPTQARARIGCTLLVCEPTGLLDLYLLIFV